MLALKREMPAVLSYTALLNNQYLPTSVNVNNYALNTYNYQTRNDILKLWHPNNSYQQAWM